MQPIICDCCVVYGTVAEREVVVVVDESGVVFLAGRSELVVQRFRRCISVVRRFVGMTLLSFTDGAADFAVRSRRLTSLLTSSAVASPMVSVVPPTMTISLIVCVLAASSIISSISLNVAPDLLTTRIWLLLSGPSKWTSRSKLLPTSSVSCLGFPDNVLVVGSISVRYPTNLVDINLYPHLADLPMPRVGKYVQAGVLIGMSCIWTSARHHFVYAYLFHVKSTECQPNDP